MLRELCDGTCLYLRFYFASSLVLLKHFSVYINHAYEQITFVCCTTSDTTMLLSAEKIILCDHGHCLRQHTC